jgi:hypothetical protein
MIDRSAVSCPSLTVLTALVRSVLTQWTQCSQEKKPVITIAASNGGTGRWISQLGPMNYDLKFRTDNAISRSV